MPSKQKDRYQVVVGTWTPTRPGRLDFKSAAKIAARAARDEMARGAQGEMITVWDDTFETVIFHPCNRVIEMTDMSPTQNSEWSYIAAAIRNAIARAGE